MQRSICRFSYALNSYVTGQQRRRLPVCVPSSVAPVASHTWPHQAVSFLRRTVICYSAEAVQAADPFCPQSVRETLEEIAAEDAAATARRLAIAAKLPNIQNSQQFENKPASKSSRPVTGNAQVLDDSQHTIKASSIPLYAWSTLIKLRMAGVKRFRE